jgi:hypothetical protein
VDGGGDEGADGVGDLGVLGGAVKGSGVRCFYLFNWLRVCEKRMKITPEVGLDRGGRKDNRVPCTVYYSSQDR